MVANIRTLLRMRSEMSPTLDSQYLFATPTGERPFRGSDVIREYAKRASVSNPSLFTCTTLRKQVATLSQTMEISKWDQDQLATFLGHDIRVHRQIYRQPIDLLQKVKVAKILLAVNRGLHVEGLDLHQTVDVDEELDTDDSPSETPMQPAVTPVAKEAGNLEVQTNVMESDSGQSDTETCQSQQTQVPPPTGQSVTETCQSQQTQVPPPTSQSVTEMRTKQLKRTWTPDEEKAVLKHLGHCVSMNKIPRKDEVQLALCAEPVLRRRSWKNVKDFVYNRIQKTGNASQSSLDCLECEHGCHVSVGISPK